MLAEGRATTLRGKMGKRTRSPELLPSALIRRERLGWDWAVEKALSLPLWANFIGDLRGRAEKSLAEKLHDVVNFGVVCDATTASRGWVRAEVKQNIPQEFLAW